MDKIELYRQYLRQIFEEYHQYQPALGDVKMELIIDPTQDHYELMSVGWNGNYRIHGAILHADIKNGQIWIQHDGTEGGIANELVDLGVPKKDIVLAFQSPFKRPYTGFGTGDEWLTSQSE